MQISRAEENAPADTSEFAEFLKSFNLTEEEFQSRVNSTKMFGGSSPVSFSGEGRVKIQFHQLETDMDWLQDDLSYIQSGWEGNESLIRLGMVARAGRNTILYSKIGFQHTMQGDRWEKEQLSNKQEKDGQIVQTRHDKSNVVANIHEDLGAGMALRTKPVSFWLRMGNINWIEASPFTIWKAQPRTFAWEFLPFEIEQPIARYYEYNVAVGEKAGRAAWHKKPFNGINLESISLPANLYLDVLWGTIERFDNFEREYIDFTGDIAYSDAFPLKATGIGDTYRHIFHARLAGIKMLGGLTIGLNFNHIDYRDDVFSVQDGQSDRFLQVFNIDGSLANPSSIDGVGFYKEPSVLSLDIRGPIAKGLFDIHSDIALGRVDTTFMTWRDDDSTDAYTKRKSSSSITPAFYTKLGINAIKSLPLQLDLAVIGKGFYSPHSFVAPHEAFYAFGSNLVGSGKFMAGHEASPYVQNMAGALLSVMPKLPGYGHFKVAYGQHMQLEAGRDILYFPFRLNGLDMFTIPHSSYNRWFNGHVADFPRDGDYGYRLGDESFETYANSPRSIESGGLFMGYLSTFECFVPYPDSVMALRNSSVDSDSLNNLHRSRTYVDSTGAIVSPDGFVPVNRKFTNNFEIDMAYDISDLIGYPYNFFLGGYFALNNVSKALTFLPVSDGDRTDDIQLWSLYFRFEPAVQLSKKFYLLGIFGYENWRSNKSYMKITNASWIDKYLRDDLKKEVNEDSRYEDIYWVPIDYRDFAVGLGFDWEILNRVGLHGRVKYMWHKDKAYSRNDWSTPIMSLEIKTWF